MIDCPMAGTVSPNNGTTQCTKKNQPGSLCEYKCQPGYSLSGAGRVI